MKILARFVLGQDTISVRWRYPGASVAVLKKPQLSGPPDCARHYRERAPSLVKQADATAVDFFDLNIGVKAPAQDIFADHAVDRA